MNFEAIIKDAYEQVKTIEDQGQLASYIPELKNVDPQKFGVYIATIDQYHFGMGDYNEKFSIQSIAKVLALCLAYSLVDEKIWERIGVEPSGTAFNSLVQLEVEHGIPRNPFINAGALVMCDILLSHLSNPKAEFLAFVNGLLDTKTVNYSSKVAESEKLVGFRNVALCNYLKALGNLENNPDQVLDFYFNLCSLEFTCEELAQLFTFLANDGFNLRTKKQVLTWRQTKRINALMQTCGFYDESGEFAFKVGLPGKSGVGGGIIGIHPKEYAIVVWSPKLNAKGNSYKGMKFLEAFTTLAEHSIF